MHALYVLSIATDFLAEKPTPKAIQVRISKLREDGKALEGLGGASPKRKRAENDDPSVDDRPIKRRRHDRPELDPEQTVFEGSAVTWGDLPEDLRNDVRHNVERRAQEIEWDARGQDWARRHNRRYAQQLRRQEEAEREGQEAADAAQALVDLRQGKGGKLLHAL